MKKKLLVFHPALAPYRIDFFNFLAENFDASFYFSRENLVTQKFDQQKLKAQCNFEINILPHGFDIGVRVVRLGVMKIIKKLSPEIILSSEYGQITLAILCYKKLTGAKFRVYTIADDSIDLSIQRSGIRKLFRNWAARHLDGVLLPTAEVGKWFRKYVNNEIKVMDLPVAYLNKRFREHLLSAIPFAEKEISKHNLVGRKVYLFVGRLVDVKNLELLLRAFAKINLKDKLLVIVGNGELKEKLHNLAAELRLGNHVIFTGRLEGSELIAWYNIAGCFVLASYQETFGAVVNEALLAGCKVICSKLAGAAELINQDNGILFDPYNQAELTRILEEAGKDMQAVQLPLRLREDRMPFNLEDKFREIVENL